MELRWLALTLVIVILTQTTHQQDDESPPENPDGNGGNSNSDMPNNHVEDQAAVDAVVSQINSRYREKNDLTDDSRPEPTPEDLARYTSDNDMKFTVNQAKMILNFLENGDDETSANSISASAQKWKFPIAYAFTGAHSESEKAIVRKGIELWQSSTCATYREYPSRTAIGNQPHLYVVKEGGCWSYMGVISNNGQALSLADGCVYPGIVAHEFGHALGFFHEHMRPDRDNYIAINSANILKGQESQFTKVPSDLSVDYGTSYDLSSVMHYNSLGFSVDFTGKKRVITPKDPTQLAIIGNRNYLSFNDVKRINLHYGCVSQCTNKLPQPCQNDGYQDPKNCNKCRCPPGTGGNYCEGVEPSTGQCGGTINVPRCSTVKLTSPSYPNSYSRGVTCNWKIESSGGLVFGFEKKPDMSANYDDSCNDFVDIITDMSKVSLPGARFCSSGKADGRVAKTDDGKAYVVFRSYDTSSGQNSGFSLVVYSTCSGTTAANLASNCVFTSTGYDGVNGAGASSPKCPTGSSGPNPAPAPRPAPPAPRPAPPPPPTPKPVAPPPPPPPAPAPAPVPRTTTTLRTTTTTRRTTTTTRRTTTTTESDSWWTAYTVSRRRPSFPSWPTDDGSDDDDDNDDNGYGWGGWGAWGRGRDAGADGGADTNPDDVPEESTTARTRAARRSTTTESSDDSTNKPDEK